MGECRAASDREVSAVIPKPALTSVPINAEATDRWSGRAYDVERAVSREDLTGVLEAGRWAPSCMNEQPWRVIVCDRHTDPDAWEQAFEVLAPSNQKWVHFAPVLGVICSYTRFDKDDTTNRWHAYDAGQAAISMALEATARGLMMHQMGGYEADDLRATFGIPDRYTIHTMFTLGYQLPVERVPATMKIRELTPRTRRPLGQLFFAGKWGEGFTGVR